MDGVKAAEAIRSGAAGEQNRSIPIIAVTAYAMNGDQERFRNSDMDGYIAKPVDVPAIEKVLKHIKAFRS
ncbi:MAG: response regulator [Desulfonatronovibrionaceae bacterium]